MEDQIPNDEDLLFCITDAFGYNGKLAKTVLEGLRTHYIDSLNHTLETLTFRRLISRKNPYLYRSSGIQTVDELVDRALTDFVSSSTEGTFGNALDWIARRLPGNTPATGGEADLQRVSGNNAEIYTIKSGPAGFNDASWTTTKQKMVRAKNSLELERILRQTLCRICLWKKTNHSRQEFWYHTSCQQRVLDQDNG